MFHRGVPTEDPHAWVNDCCFLTRMANDGKGALMCVTRVVADDDESAADLEPKMSLPYRMARDAWRAVAAAWERWRKPEELSLSAEFGQMADLSEVPADQLRLGLSEAVLSGDQGAAAYIAAELARRREAVASNNKRVSRSVSNGNAAGFIAGTVVGSPARGREASVAEQPDTNQLIGSLWAPSQTGAQQRPMWG
jgi:hypothetical protein